MEFFFIIYFKSHKTLLPSLQRQAKSQQGQLISRMQAFSAAQLYHKSRDTECSQEILHRIMSQAKRLQRLLWKD